MESGPGRSGEGGSLASSRNTERLLETVQGNIKRKRRKHKPKMTHPHSLTGLAP